MKVSDHDEFEGRGSRLAPVAAIKDATHEGIGAPFREQEDTVVSNSFLAYGLPIGSRGRRAY
jgi:hypothetical protein